MKKKFLIISASISLLLACFPFTLFAEDAPASDPGPAPASLTPGLDSYFWENYDLLPYIESNGNQYIETDVHASNDLITRMKFSDLRLTDGAASCRLFGINAGNSSYYAYWKMDNGVLYLLFQSANSGYQHHPEQYAIYDLQFGKDIYLNGVLLHSFTDTDFTSTYTIPIFAYRNNGNLTGMSIFKLYSFSIYDTDQEEYVKYYYPAKAKSGGTIGLYDAVSKTFVTTSTATPFENPQGSQPLEFDVGVFINSGLGWIGDILDFAISEPVILLFMAIGLAGATFRWARRLVHF